MQSVSPLLQISLIVLFCTVDDITVPVTTGLPATAVNTPAPLKGKVASYNAKRPHLAALEG
jgi:hypothetical protein